MEHSQEDPRTSTPGVRGALRAELENENVPTATIEALVQLVRLERTSNERGAPAPAVDLIEVGPGGRKPTWAERRARLTWAMSYSPDSRLSAIEVLMFRELALFESARFLRFVDGGPRQAVPDPLTPEARAAIGVRVGLALAHLSDDQLTRTDDYVCSLFYRACRGRAYHVDDLGRPAPIEPTNELDAEASGGDTVADVALPAPPREMAPDNPGLPYQRSA